MALMRLCELAHERAVALGHDLSAWEPPPGEEEIAMRARCRRCGRTVYVRIEKGLEGIAGRAVTERCDGAALV